ncbi:uncharacterized protein LOC143221405 [Lasioglossum baleicum]|uniref:uncharacterized protein LOC143221405 n=1 Tax=Lasioglossum baleicum TaxID=434251 RepID=UPI003FCE3A39
MAGTKNLKKKSVNTNCNINRKSSVLVSKANMKKKNKRLNYTPESIKNAIKALDTGISLRKAASAYGVPVATLARRKNNPEVVKMKTGPATVLTETEELEIVNWILYRAERGYPVNKTELLDCVQKYIQSLKKETPFIENRPGRHWYEGFRKRHQNLTIRSVQHLSLSRAAVTSQNLTDWFNEQEMYLNTKNLLDIPPNRIFNCDETSIALCPDSDKVLTKKGCRSTYKITDTGKENLTVLFMYSAAGTRAPPMIMFPYIAKVPKDIIENTPKGWGIGISESGWMTTETFYEYVTNVFHPWLVQENIQFPVILYLDNHTSHITIPVVSFCRDRKIELIGLYPNSTHILQPLDIAFFHPFKQAWQRTVPKWKVQNNRIQIKKGDFPLVLKMALDSLKDEKDIIQSGFKASGLVPFNPNAVDYDILNKPKRSISTHAEGNVKEHQVTSNNVMEDKNQHLQTFEKNISPEQLLEFKNSNGQWTGNIEKKGLFEYWLQIGGTSFGINTYEDFKIRNYKSSSNMILYLQIIYLLLIPFFLMYNA